MQNGKNCSDNSDNSDNSANSDNAGTAIEIQTKNKKFAPSGIKTKWREPRKRLRQALSKFLKRGKIFQRLQNVK